MKTLLPKILIILMMCGSFIKAAEPSVYQNWTEDQARSVLQKALDQMDPALMKTLREQVSLAKKEFTTALAQSDNQKSNSDEQHFVDVVCYYTSVALIGKVIGGFCMDIHANSEGKRKIYFLQGYGLGFSGGLKGSIVFGFFHNPETTDIRGEYESITVANFKQTAHVIAHILGYLTRVRSLLGLDFVMSYQTQSYATNSETNGIMVMLGAGLGLMVDLAELKTYIQ